MKDKIDNVLFYAIGILVLLNQVFGMYIIAVLLGIIYGNWFVPTIVCILITAVDVYRHLHYRKLGMRGTLGRYTKEWKTKQ